MGLGPLTAVFAWAVLVSAAPDRGYEGTTAVTAAEPDAPGESVGPTPPHAVEFPPAPKSPPPKPPPLRPWTAGGFIDLAYLYNNNLPDNHVYRGASTTPRTGEFTLNLAAIYIRRTPTRGRPFWLDVGFQAGAAADALFAAEPVPGGAAGRFAGAEVWKHVGTANAGIEVPKLGTKIGGGLFTSPIGIGSFWSPGDWNYTPSWTANATPFYLMGGRVSQPLPAGFWLDGWVVNGWQSAADVNKVPSYLLGTRWSSERGAEVAQYVFFGPENTDISASTYRVHSDTWFTVELDRLGLGLVADVGTERLSDQASAPRQLWVGGALFVRGRVIDRPKVRFDLAARPEGFWDRDGRLYGTTDNLLLAGTATASLDLYRRVLVRAEYRFDRSTAPGGFFYRRQAITDNDAALAAQQHTFGLSLVVRFEHAFRIRTGD